MEQDKKDKFIELRAQGLSFDAISKQLSISKPTLIKLERELGDDVQWLKFMHMETLAEQYKMMRAARLERLGAVLQRVDAAVEAADFSRLSPDKLIELRIRLSDKMIEELDFGYIARGDLSEMRRNDRLSDFALDVLD